MYNMLFSLSCAYYIYVCIFFCVCALCLFLCSIASLASFSSNFFFGLLFLYTLAHNCLKLHPGTAILLVSSSKLLLFRFHLVFKSVAHFFFFLLCSV